MANRTTESNWHGRGGILLAGPQPYWERLAARDDDLCVQCHFPWHLHQERYDAEEKSAVRVCSEFPAEPVRSIQECIAP